MSTLRIAAEAILAVTTPLPERTKSDPGLMTLQEFLTYRNPKDKWHPSDAYQTTVGKLNTDLYTVDTVVDVTILSPRENPNLGMVFERHQHVIGVYHDGTLYFSRHQRRHIPKGVRFRGEHIRVAPTKEVEVKYPSEYVRLVSDIAKKNKSRYPTVLQRMKVGDEYLELRSEAPLVKDEGMTIVLLNEQGEVVAQASDEWGTTLLMVTSEYRGKNLGVTLGKVWYQWNPKYGSGGFTPSGYANARRIWSSRVREYLENGWYSELVRSGEMSAARVQEITKDLLQRPKDVQPKAKEKGDVLVLIDPNESYFIIYNSLFLTHYDDEDSDKYILGYGFLRDSSGHGTYPYRIDYERPYQVLATGILLQMARNQGDKLYIGDLPSDMVELDGVPHVKVEDGYVTLTQDIHNLKQMRDTERRRRKPMDPHQELEHRIHEAADSKW